jgi:3-hydroxyacyl-CoA dehydrogenase
MFVFKAAVVGAGTMGGEIAQVIAAADVPVVLKDVRPELVDAGLARAEQVTRAGLARRVEQGRLTAEQADAQAAALLGRITGATDYESFGDVDLVVEAVPERMDVKHAVYAELDRATPGHAILASNTSALSITEIGEATGRPDKVCGLHFFWPASVMRVVEVVEGDRTSPDTVRTAMAFAQRIRKAPVRCGEGPGFVVNRILVAAASEVWRVQDETGADVEEIDRIVAGSGVVPMGPFLLADLSGLDTTVHVAEHLAESLNEADPDGEPDRFHVHAGMRAKVAAGELGRKTGKGFYEHGR